MGYSVKGSLVSDEAVEGHIDGVAFDFLDAGKNVI